MKFPIGFAFNDESKQVEMEPVAQQEIVPVKSLAQVYFLERNQTLTYFNDQFDLKRGDFVFVDGKLEGIRGIVREANKNFKIKVSDYKRLSVWQIPLCPDRCIWQVPTLSASMYLCYPTKKSVLGICLQ